MPFQDLEDRVGQVGLGSQFNVVPDNCHDIVYSENCHDIVDSQL